MVRLTYNLPYGPNERKQSHANGESCITELVLHHLTEMMAGFSTRKERTKLTQCSDLVDIIDLLDSQWQIKRIKNV